MPLLRACQFFKTGKDTPLVTVHALDAMEVAERLTVRNPATAEGLVIGILPEAAMDTSDVLRRYKVVWMDRREGAATQLFDTGFYITVPSHTSAHRTSSSAHVYPRLPRPHVGQ